MDFRFTPEQERFREEIRAFLDRELPSIPPEEMAAGFSRTFSKKLAARGWIGLAWPKEYGGHNLSALDRLIFTEELILRQAPTGYHFVAERQMGPSLIAYGSEEQKREHLPKIINADESWAIGMSEPNAGSDLANVQTRAVRDGDEYVINGRKRWTGNAKAADYISLLCRTADPAPGEPRSRGISTIIIEKERDSFPPGIKGTLIDKIGYHGFLTWELEFDNFRVPAQNLVGARTRRGGETPIGGEGRAFAATERGLNVAR